MKKLLATFLSALICGACLCGNAVAVKDTTYCDDGIMPLASSTIDIDYESKSTDEFNIVLKHPNYVSSPYVASCACVAGANVVGFYDRYDENLIPNHDAGYNFMGQFIYKMEDTYVTEVVKQLYADMGTDATGTTVTQFKNGMTTFCNRKGKNISFSSCMRNNKFDYEIAKSFMKANLPVVLFCDGYNVANFGTSENSDTIYYYESSANHVMVGFGYQVINYSITSNSNVLYQFIEVASGTNNKSSGYYDINYGTKINDAYAVYIY